MRWTIHIVKRARKTLLRVPKRDRQYILNALKKIEGNPFSGDLDWLKDQPATFRHRVGDWRILFDIDLETHLIIVLDIKRRSSKTY